ncbi:MAG: Gfo/Idh/MocA family oxidoreductase [Proteobacteria bacterium]|nr:Gfo/Idh/MocA family oxidoreductase [Pseudomonadota bacterium]MBI3498614.1 Gfo/Idh/MocA family oxidoreductase [Pseudomonadota bacterium]
MTGGAKKLGPFKMALAGAGMISAFHLKGWQKLGNRVELVALCDPDPERGQARAKEFGIAKVYQDRDRMLEAEAIDVLDIASPRETHAAWVEAAARRGIDVLCQKPMTPTLAESEALVRRVGDRIRLMVHENWRFRPWYRVLKAWIEEGALGRILHADMAMINSGFLPDAEGLRFSLNRQPFMQHEKRLMIAEVLIHHLDVMRYLLGELRVGAARATRTVPDIVGETMASIFLETAEGASAVVTGTMAAAGYQPRVPDRLEILGSTASVLFENDELRLLGPKPRSQRYDRDQGYQASFDGVIRHFIECLETGQPFETDPADNLQTLRLVEHAYWAAGLHETGKRPARA